MIIYSVTINIETEHARQWLAYMREVHIPEVMATGCFSGYRLCRLLNEEDNGGITYNTQYELASMARYDDYVDNFAPALQKDHADKFGGHFVAFRTLLEKVE